jgi:ABC-type nitrate/sulfonate/bicarbonate transport system substrate-binding protein
METSSPWQTRSSFLRCDTGIGVPQRFAHEAMPRLRLAVPDLVSNSYFPVIAAVELGLFEAQGLDAGVQLLFPVPRTMDALRAGELDFVAGAAHATLMAFPAWRGARLLAAIAQHTYWFLVLRSDLPVERADLHAIKGLRIGAAPGVDLALHRLLVESGIDPERDGVQIAPVPGTGGPTVSFGVTAAQALEQGLIDGFWANGMGAEVAVRRGVGRVVLDVRRGDGPPSAPGYTFPALVTTERRIEQEPETVAAAVRALVQAQLALRADPERAREVGRRIFPPMEAELIAELIRRDAPFYDPTITPAAVATLNAFARAEGLPVGENPVGYQDVVATEFASLWITD